MRSFCYGLEWLFHFKMSPNTAMNAQRLRSGSIFSPVQSSLEISLSTAKLRSAERGTHFVTSPHEVWGVTEVCCSGTPVSFAYYTTDTS